VLQSFEQSYQKHFPITTRLLSPTVAENRDNDNSSVKVDSGAFKAHGSIIKNKKGTPLMIPRISANANIRVTWGGLSPKANSFVP